MLKIRMVMYCVLDLNQKQDERCNTTLRAIRRLAPAHPFGTVVNC